MKPNIVLSISVNLVVVSWDREQLNFAFSFFLNELRNLQFLYYVSDSPTTQQALVVLAQQY